MSNILELNDVTIRFGGITAVKELTMNVPKDKIIGLIGPNGAGKTTVFNLISGFYKPTEGEIFFKQEKISEKSTHEICGRGVARTFQNIRLFTNQTALENVMVGGHVRRKYAWWTIPLCLPSAMKEEREIRRNAYELLERLSLAEYADELATSLPYGAQRRLEIARALATQPKLLLLDEPAAGMNPQESLELLDFIKEIRSEFDLSILLIEHDMKVVMGVCEHIWVLEYGSLIANGNPHEIQKNPAVIAAYLGDEINELYENEKEEQCCV
ncbi:ABC transporter ATP-binding protein [Desulfovibrio litoralis]|uniref:Amino acid/amide ABC transporter ATP-binding protein 1, HAAT family n=1 Tax=Desulfovibrio litoralis DSM 11393 TaxID=1121455 RepID=A0A1M7TFL8_9BACT|nr:ABC transporter ATP-binding protein [Desulfovibrio litoralis]SHN69496.1 amino acid/amide ABC transporter ATP-binding protein 1, HAAT family [Desulfovibrio litoralis DSM 11393]